jgi:hypothetical protein
VFCTPPTEQIVAALELREKKRDEERRAAPSADERAIEKDDIYKHGDPWTIECRLTNLPEGRAVLLDKGFDKISGWFPNCNAVLHPAFLTKGKFNPEQIRCNLSICHDRCTCEVVHARVAQTENLQGVLKREKFGWFEAIMNWGHGHANLEDGS